MQSIDYRLAMIREREKDLRRYRDSDGAANRRSRSFRLRLGGLLMRLGRRIGGDLTTAPAWQG